MSALRARLALAALCECASLIMVRDDDMIVSEYEGVASPLDQLRAAAGSSAMSGGAPGKAAPIPIDPGAVDLLKKITDGTRFLAGQVGAVFPPRWWHPPLVWSFPQRPAIEWWLAEVVARTGLLDAESLAGLALTLEGWVAAIENHFDPPRHLHLARACPSCGKRMVAKEEGAEQVQQPALLFDTSGAEESWSCTCQACGERWGPGRHYLKRLAVQIEQMERARQRAGLSADGVSMWRDGTLHLRRDITSNMAVQHEDRHGGGSAA